jgi:hypothetical protein
MIFLKNKKQWGGALFRGAGGDENLKINFMFPKFMALGRQDGTKIWKTIFTLFYL